MLDNQMQNSGFSYGNFTWWFGVVEKRDDPEKLGRVRVRVLGYHSPEVSDIAADKLLWAYPIQPIVSSAMNGIGLSPTGIVEGTWVMGFFRDGVTAQDAVIMGTVGGKPEGKEQHDDGDGFKDEDDTYPRDEFLNESDVNRLARHEDLENTTLEKQKQGEDQGVPTALKGQSRTGKQVEKWDEKSTTYNAKYPFNHVKETERGHQEEWDDTKDSERYRRWHRCGTMVEQHADGDSVRRIKRNNYDVILGENYLHVIGDCTITIGAGDDLATIPDDKMDWEDNTEEGEDGPFTQAADKWDESRKVDASPLNVLVKGDVNLECEGDMYQKVHGKMELYVGLDLQIKSGGTIYMDGSPDIHMNKPGPALEVESIEVPDWSANKKRT